MAAQVQSVAEANFAQETAKFPRALSFLFDKTMPDGVTPVRYKVGYGGRGGTKTWGFARALLMNATTGLERVMCARQYQNSIKESVHKTLADQITALRMNYVFEVQQASIKARPDAPLLPNGEKNSSEFFFKGMHNNMAEIKSTEGITKCWVEEAHNVTRSSWDTLDPTVRADGSEIWVSFNPQLETDATYVWFVLNTPVDAIVRKLTWRDNPFFNDVLRRQMEAMKLKDYDSYLHVWEGECVMTLEGAVYAKELRKARAEGRICRVPYDPAFPVSVSFDLGRSDATAMWFRQSVGFENRMLQYYENSMEDLDHYFDVLDAMRDRTGQRYFYGMFWLPADAKAKRLGTKKSIYEQFQTRFGPQRVRVVPSIGLANGINAARQAFRTTWFDQEFCGDGIQMLSHYRYVVLNADTGELSREPLHNEASHGADAFRYDAVSRKIGVALPTPSPRQQIQEELDEAQAKGYFVPQYGRPSRGDGGGGQGWMGR